MRKRLAGVVSIVMVVVCVVAARAVTRPFPAELLDRGTFLSTTVTAREGSRLHDGYAAAGTKGDWLATGEWPPVLEHAVLAVEDHRFRRHGGVDVAGVLRATLSNLRSGRIREGGSTITQQTVKLLLQARERRDGGGMRARSLRNKSEEAILALRLERELSKDEILGLWLNLAPFGGSTVGVRRASAEIFGVEPRDLTVAQASVIAGIPNRPSAFDPRIDPEAAQRRRDHVLDRMLELKLIDAATWSHARGTPLKTVESAAASGIAPHAVARVLAEFEGRAADVESTLDPVLQSAVRGIIEARRRDLDRHGARAVAAVVLDNETGEWLAWEGSGAWGDPLRDGSIDGVTTPRQPGSALKPFVYAAAFERGFTPASVLADVRTSYPTSQPGVSYVPVNYDGKYRGPVLARAALAGSLNAPAVQITSEIGVPSVIRLLRSASISTLDASPDWYGLGVALGGGEVPLGELVAAYAAFPRGGLWVEPKLVRRWKDGAGRWHVTPAGRSRRIFSAETAFLVSDVLSDASARAFTFGRGGALETDFPSAVKTGTSQSYRDNWTIGYTSRVTVGVWVGNFDRTPLRSSSGVTGAAPIFNAIISAAEEAYPSSGRVTMASSSGLRKGAVCTLSGEAAASGCPARSDEWLHATSASTLCSWHDAGGGVRYPPAYDGWSRARPRAAAGNGVEQRGGMNISHPPDGAVYLYDPTLRAEFQTVPLRVRGGRGAVRWSVDGKFFATTTGDERVELPLRRGRIVISARDAAGRAASSTIEVR